jgi:hypothetical protein
VSEQIKESGEEVSEIQRLTARVHDLSTSIANWNSWYMVLVFLTVILAAGVFLTQFVVGRKQKSLSSVQDELITEKDRIAKVDSDAKDRRIADATQQSAESNKAAGYAIERAAKAEENAGVANRIAEEEKLARIKIEKQLAPRTLSESDREKIGKDLQKFAPTFSARKIKISSFVGDAEGIVFSLELLDVVTRSGIEVDPVIGRLQQVGLIDLGVKITGPAAHQEFMKAFATDVRADCDTLLNVVWGPQFSEVTIEVGVKPVAGLPTVVQAASQ